MLFVKKNLSCCTDFGFLYSEHKNLDTLLFVVLFKMFGISMKIGWLVGCRVCGRLSHEGPRPMGNF